MDADVIIIGAGAAGLLAADELAGTNGVLVLEARNRIGGRIDTRMETGFRLPAERGAEFVHGTLPLTLELLKRAWISRTAVNGSLWQFRDGRLCEQEDFVEDFDRLEKKFAQLSADIPVQEFFDLHLSGPADADLRTSLQHYVEGYYAADPKRASTAALRRELTTGNESQFRPKGGYAELMRFLARSVEGRGGRILTAQAVTEVHWQAGRVRIKTARKEWTARRALVTVPLGLWQQQAIRYEPALTAKQAAARELGLGGVIKIWLQFREAFWTQQKAEGRSLADLGFVFSDEQVPTWWTAGPPEAGVLNGWLAGPRALGLEQAGDETILAAALGSLARIFSVTPGFLRQSLQHAEVANWVSDPFTRGGYSYEVVNGPAHQAVLRAPEADTLFVAGEALQEGPTIGTVEAALQSGRDAARAILASLAKNDLV